ncbi:sugar phosphate isomerase/epimerase family protein [Phytoactinopolyspora halotolerans]|uniref:Sugar phosphate isomerase/epimerase n=1 Tax=Phytoactinopolyspora halotolerans TaxID=1981512 RepID=A0A6L9SFH6_9ACTN|nr:sugar phosphate isomerase/epimerase [Phytoactinopolyspora halotolerans]NEE03907.1 sugar phosphate isomerase/epimerase [Phytoactinopolyspora halotolerans]
MKTIASLDFEVVDIAAVPTLFDHIRTIDPPPNQAKRLATLVSDLGLDVNSVISVLWAPDAWDDLDELRRRSVIAADAAAAVEAKSWIVEAGVWRPSETRTVAIERFKRTIAMQYGVASERSLRLVVEAPHGGTLAEDYDGMVEILGAAADVGAEVGLDVDLRPALTCGVPTVQILDVYFDVLAHIAVADAVSSGAGFVKLGDGEVDVRAAVNALMEKGYDGDLMLELELGDRLVDERITLIEHDRNYLRNLVAEASVL